MPKHREKRIVDGKKQIYSKLAGQKETVWFYNIKEGREMTEEECRKNPKDVVIKYQYYGVWFDDVSLDSHEGI